MTVPAALPELLSATHAQCFTLPRPWSAAEFASFLADPLVFLIGDPQGFILARAVAGEAEILTLAVAPAARRQGHARRLLAEFFTTAQQHKADTVFLEVAADNSAARALYTGCGFHQTGLRRGYYSGAAGQRVDAIIMGCPITPTPPSL